MATIAFGRRALKNITLLTRTSITTSARRFVTLPPKPTPAPWLRVPIDMTDSSVVDFDNFYNIVDKRFVKLDRSYTYSFNCNVLCVGSSRGSLAFICENGRMYFGNPHTGGGYKDNVYGDQEFDDEYLCDKSNFGLHSLTRFYIKLGYNTFDDIGTFICYPRYHPKNPTPTNYHDFYVKNDSSPVNWTRYPNLFHKDDPPIVYCEKTKTVYKLSCYGNEYGPWVVELWDIPDDRINVTSRINVALDSSYEIETIQRELRARCHQDRYLVLTGDRGGRGEPVLYLVVRHHNRELGVTQTRAVDVFRFDLVEQKMSYTTKLDDHAFFIGQGSDSFAVPVEQCGPGGLKPDSIYIADDLRVFDLKDGSIMPILDTGDLSMTRFKSLWIPPPTPEQIEKGKSWITYMTGDEEFPI